MHMSSISYTQIMQWLPHEIKEKIVTNYKLTTQDRLNLRLVDKNWKRIIDNSVKIWERRAEKYRNCLDGHLWTEPQDNGGAKEIRKQIIKTEKKLGKIREKFHNYHQKYDLYRPTNYREVKARVGHIKINGSKILVYCLNGWANIFEWDGFFESNNDPISSFMTIRSAEEVHLTSHTVVVEYTIAFKREFACYDVVTGEKYLERKDAKNDMKKLVALDKHLFLSKTYDEQNKDVIHRYNVEEGRFRKTEEKLIRRNFIDFTVTATQLISLRSSYAGFGGDLIVEIADLAESIYVEPVQSRTFRINGHYNPTDFSIFEKNRLREFRRAFPPPSHRETRYEMGDFIIGLKHQSDKIFKTRYLEDHHRVNTTWVGTVEVLLNENRNEPVYRLEVQWHIPVGLYGSLAFEELKGGVGFIYNAYRHVVIKRFDQYQ